MPEIHFFKLDIMLAMVMMMLMMQGRVVPTEDSLTAEWWETRARLSAGGLLGAGCQVGEDEDDDDQEDDGGAPLERDARLVLFIMMRMMVVLLGMGFNGYLEESIPHICHFLHRQNFCRIKFTPKNTNFSR